MMRRNAKPSLLARLRALFLLPWCLVPVTACADSPSPPVLGAALDLAAMPEAARRAELLRLATAGVQSIRMPIDWDRVEPKHGAFAWAPYDAAVNDARARGLDVVLVLGPCAPWAVDPSRDVPADQARFSVPKSDQVWRQYVRSVATHFKGRVSYYQLREQPSARNFRGGRAEFLALVTAAAATIRAVNPKAKVIVPEAGYFDVAAAERFLRAPEVRAADVYGLYTPRDLHRLPLQWAVLAHEIIPSVPPAARRPLWVLDLEEGATPEIAQTTYLLASVFGAERCYLPASLVQESWTTPFHATRYQGFANFGPDAWLLFFSAPDGPRALAWAAHETTIAVSTTAVTPPPCPATSLPDEGGAAPAPSEHPAPAPTAVTIGPAPQWIDPAPWSLHLRLGPPTRADVIAARAKPDLSALPLVYFDLSRDETQELGLYNRQLRYYRGGAVVEEDRYGQLSAHLHLEPFEERAEFDNPWLFLEVDDSWLFLDQGKTDLTVAVECQGSLLGPEKLGFNIMYDAVTGYRSTPWQWVEPGYEWRWYRVPLKGVSFGNREGWDLRINAKGSLQDLWIRAVSVEKALPLNPLPEPAVPQPAADATTPASPLPPQIPSNTTIGRR